MDEPFGAVDPIVRLRLQEELLEPPTPAAQDDRVRDARHRRGDPARPTAWPCSTSAGCSSSTSRPVDVLAEPSGAFVLEFLGADRGLKRLALIPVSAAELQPGPTVERRSADRERARGDGARTRRLGRGARSRTAARLGRGRARSTVTTGSSEIEPTRVPGGGAPDRLAAARARRVGELADAGGDRGRRTTTAISASSTSRGSARGWRT